MPPGRWNTRTVGWRAVCYRAYPLLLLLGFADACLSAGAGSYCPSLFSGTRTCPVGSWCPGGGIGVGPNSCPAGRYGSQMGLSSSLCTGPCQAGSYGASGGLTTAACSGACSPGSWCPAGSTSATQNDCQAGYFGSSGGQTAATCSGPCQAGYWCAAGSTTNTQNTCQAGSFSGVGSIGCSACSAGSWCTAASPSATQNACPPGSYCVAGAAAPTFCPAGSFGSTSSLQTASCSGTCPIGSFCPVGSVNPTLCPGGRFGSATGLSLSSCSGPCLASYYCPEGSTVNNAFLCTAGSFCGAAVGFPTPCPAGRWGLAGESSPQCQATPCQAGYYCPSGSISPTVAACGGVDRYCPAGSGTPTLITDGTQYSIPLTPGTENYRTGALPCPGGRQCVGGALLAGLSFSSGCSGGTAASTTILSGIVNAPWGPTFAVITPGYVGSVDWAITSVAPVDAGCPVTVSYFNITSLSQASARLWVGATAVQLSSCPNGLALVISATRSNDATLSSSCALTVAVGQVISPPSITNCADSRSVVERTPTGTFIGSPLSASVSTSGTAITWAIIAAPSFPASIGLCDGQLRVKTPMSWAAAPTYTMTVQATNDGSALGIGSASSTCIVSFSVVQAPLAPVIVVNAFTAIDLSANGTVVGSVGASDPSNFTITNHSWVAVDSPNAFAIDATTGLVTFAIGAIDTLVLGKSTWRYTLAVCDAYACGAYPVTINVVQATRPPTIVPQNRTVAEGTPGGSLIGPALIASQAQGLPYNFSVAPTDVFGISASGVLFLQSGVTLNYRMTPYYTLTVAVTTASGASAAAVIGVLVTEVVKPPVFASPVVFAMVAEGAPSGAAIVTVTATSFNTIDSLRYALLGALPAGAAPWFAIDSSSGVISVSYGGALLVNPALSYPAGFFTVNVTVGVVNVGGLRANATVVVSVTGIAPRATSVNASIAANSTGGTPVAVLASSVWSAYPGAALSFSIQPVATPAGFPAFSVSNTTSGAVIVTDVSYVDNNTGIAYAGPGFNRNTQPVVVCAYQVIDLARGLSTTGILSVTLMQSNRQPWWSPIPELFAPQNVAGGIGAPLSVYANDLDLALGIGEVLTYAIVSANPASFTLDPVSGQLRAPALTSLQSYVLTLQVSDAGLAGPVMQATTNVTITVARGVFPPSLPPYTFSVPELSPAGTFVGNLTGYSLNDGPNLSYTISPSIYYATFPFTVVSVPGPGGSIVGSVYTTATGATALSFGAGPNPYLTTCTVFNNNPVSPMSAFASVSINVSWVARPPRFGSGSTAPGSAWFQLEVNEQTAAGTPVLPAGGSSAIFATSKDSWASLKYNWLGLPPALANWFNLDPVGGNVSLGSAAALDFAVAKSYNLTAQVTYVQLGLTDTAAVTVWIREVNKPAVWQSLYNASTGAPIATINISEATLPGTIIARAAFSDPNTAFPWNSRSYSLIGGYGSALFSIDAVSGNISVAPLSSGLSYWDSPTYALTVACMDSDPLTPLTSTRVITVVLTQVNTVTVSGFNVPASVPPVMGSNSSGSVLVTTTGGTLVEITGTGFGPTGRYIEAASPSATLISATYGAAPYGPYAATACAVYSPNTVIRCMTAAGVGAGLAWTVTVAGAWSATSSTTTAYFAPVVSAVRKWTGGSPSASSALTTEGGDIVAIDGTNLSPFVAPTSDMLVWRYWSAAAPATIYTWTSGLSASPGSCAASPGAPGSCCSDPSAPFGTRLICTTLPGSGAGLSFQVRVGGQWSAAFNSTSVAYAPPTVTGVAVVAIVSSVAGLLDTRGGDMLIVNGSNLGPTSTPASSLLVTYAGAGGGASQLVFTALACSVPASASSAAIICLTAPGAGAGLLVSVSVAGQAAPAFAGDSIAYRPPTLDALGGRTALAGTPGGDAIVITGDQFGPVSTNVVGIGALPLVSASYGYPADAVLRYAAASCGVTTAHTTMTCLTAPGTGAGLVWAVTVANQSSARLLTATTSYAPPTVALFSGPGASLAHTYGYETVAISGINFGPLGTVINSATYGVPNGTQLVSPGCILATPHTLLWCNTSVGAGSGLSWTVTIGGQASVAPTTNYGPPAISSLGGVVGNASTNGGDAVVLHGTFLSTQPFLGAVTYGPSGIEFTATGCSVTVDHVAVTCLTVPGTGRKLRWAVTVGGQMSPVSTSWSSYATPSISSVSPGHGSTTGGMVATITGANFGLAYAASRLVIKINNLMLARPPPSQWDPYIAAVLGAQISPCPACDAWLASLYSTPAKSSSSSGSVDSVSFVIPPGFGPAADVYVIVDGVPSTNATFTYDAPVITNLAPDRLNLTAPGTLNVWIDGSSFCSSTACGNVLFNDGPPLATTVWTDSQIKIIVTDPNSSTVVNRVQVVVGGIISNALTFQKPVPGFSASVQPRVYTGMSTAGGQLFMILGVSNVGSEAVNITIGAWPCTPVTVIPETRLPTNDPSATFTLQCITPAGVGKGLPITLTTLGGSSRANSDFLFSYAPPRLDNNPTLVTVGNSSVTGRRSRFLQSIGSALIPTVGGVISLTGSNLGGFSLTSSVIATIDAAVVVSVLTLTQSNVSLAIPPGDGAGHMLQLVVAGQPSNAIAISYAPPSIIGVSPNYPVLPAPTLGGFVLTVTGSNFGVSLPLITVGSLPCPVLSPFVPVAGHGILRCTAPAGAGRDLPVIVTVQNQSSAFSNAASFRYSPPKPMSVEPTSSPTSGRALGTPIPNSLLYSPGPRIVGVVRGSNFGAWNAQSALTFNDSTALAPSSAAEVISWNDSTIVFYIPAGAGADLIVTPSVGGQTPDLLDAPPVQFSYDPPSIISIGRADRSLGACAPIQQCFNTNSSVFCTSVPAQCFDTAGGYPVIVIGESFGAAYAFPPTVTIGGQVCDGPVATDETITCTIRAGYGYANDVVVTVAQRASNAIAFAYDPPMIVTIDRQSPDANGEAITFRGKNFGGLPLPVTISIGDLACGSAAWQSDFAATCTTARDVVGPKNVSILAANQSAPVMIWAQEAALVAKCAAGFYGTAGLYCAACPRGALCPGNELNKDMVTALAGFWRVSPSQVTVATCPPERQGSALPYCVYAVACAPVESCLAGNVCASGYKGDRCSLCASGYYRANSSCAPCPSSPYAIIVVFVLGAVAALGISYALNKSGISLTLVSIGIDYAQVLAIFMSANIAWPAALMQLFTIFSAFSLNLDLTAPECALKTITYPIKWAFIELLPAFALVALGLVYAVLYVYKLCCLNITAVQRHDHLPQLKACIIVLFRVLFIYLTRTSLDVFNCVPTSPPDGQLYMAGLLQYPCGGSVQVMLLFPAIVCFCIYSVAIPGAALWFLRSKRNIVKYDMILWAKGLGDSPLTNKYFVFRRSYSQLYHHMKPGKMYWEFVILARKLCIVAVAVGLRNSASFQLASMLLVLFAAFAAQVKNSPYFSHADRPLVVAEHDEKCLTDPLHKAIEADIRAQAAKNTRARARSTKFFDAMSVAKQSPVDAAILAALDYNSVETVMLGSAILVCLSGLMFTSSLFIGDLKPLYQREYDSLAYSVIVLVSLTIIYFFANFLVDVLLVCKPDMAPRIFICGKSVNRARAAVTARLMVKGSRRGTLADEGDFGVSMSNNPSAMGFGKAFSATDIANISGLPTEQQWAAVKNGYASLEASVSTLTAEVSALKKAVGVAQTEVELGGARALVGAPKTRHEFGARLASDGSDQGAGSGSALVRPSPLLVSRLLARQQQQQQQSSSASAVMAVGCIPNPLSRTASRRSVRQSSRGASGDFTHESARPPSSARNGSAVSDTSDGVPSSREAVIRSSSAANGTEAEEVTFSVTNALFAAEGVEMPRVRDGK